jgi:flagellar hook protein FlgE
MPTFSIPLSGLTAESTALSTIANNLANLNTTGYKDQVVRFQDLFYQSLGTSGSGDPIQQGAGTGVGAIPSLFTQGNINPTGVATDVAIAGEGFLVTEKGGVTSYTRAGNFSVDKNAFLVTNEGQRVLGFPFVNGAITTGQGLKPLQLGSGQISAPTPTGAVQVNTNLDATAAVADSFSTPVTIFDSLGVSHVLTFTFTKTAANSWNYQISMPASELNPIIPGGGGAPVPQTGILKAGTLTFNGTGALTTPAADVTGIGIVNLADGANNQTFDWTLYNGASAFLTQVAAPSSTSSTHQDGAGSGSLVSFAIGSDGLITGTFSNGKTSTLGQLALATFPDEQGLLRTGNNGFAETLASGQAVVGAPGTGGRGTLSGGALELSNVDIASEFSALIIAQRGFQANARVVTTFDQITQDTIALKQG